MRLIKPNTKFDFVGRRYIAFSVSGLLILISIISLLFHGGLNYGIDFLGGSILQLKFDTAVEISQIKAGLESADISKSTVQTFGEVKNNEYLIRTDTPVTANQEFTDKLEQSLKSTTGQIAEIRRVEIVGPKVGKELQNKALLAIFYSLLFLAIYISGRFELKWMASGIIAAALMGVVYFFSVFKINMVIITGVALLVTFIFFWLMDLKYAMAAIVALVHDVIITVGMFSLFNKEFNLPIVAAILAIIGYSLNDTIIIFDRIRENLKKNRKISLTGIINKSVNETLSRTFLTSGLTLVVVIALFALGGGIIHDFAFALLVGIIIGTYSSIYVASPILIAWTGKRKKK
ncbi:MAG: protein translocase subunit SecF [Proteobacteria bacterium]|nr:protein translocase subunit SecF [Pseudomonadota bacterium]